MHTHTYTYIQIARLPELRSVPQPLLLDIIGAVADAMAEGRGAAAPFAGVSSTSA